MCNSKERLRGRRRGAEESLSRLEIYPHGIVILWTHCGSAIWRHQDKQEQKVTGVEKVLDHSG